MSSFYARVERNLECDDAGAAEGAGGDGSFGSDWCLDWPAVMSSDCRCELPRCLDRFPLPRWPDSLGWCVSLVMGNGIGHDIPRILHGICKLLPLDQYVECPVVSLRRIDL